MTYMFKCECGQSELVVRPMENRNDRFVCSSCGENMHRDFGAEGRKTRSHPGNWPMLSDALGCNESQIQESMDASQRHGCPTRFTSDGRAILTSPGHRKAYAESCGIFDRNGGYGDPQPR